MLEGIHFVYDGVKSIDMGLLNCKLDGGMFDETFLPSREIKEVTVRGNDKPYFQEVVLSPLEFNLSFAFEYNYDERRIREVARWLMQSYYKPFYTVDNPNRIFYCMLSGDSRLIHNGLKQGYITLTMRCDGAYSYTPYVNKDNMKFGVTNVVKVFEEDKYDSSMGTQQNTKFDANGNIEILNANPVWTDFTGKKWSDIS